MRPIVLFQSLLALLPAIAGQAAEKPAVKTGMSPQEVVTVLGEPDRIAVFEGKYLRDVPLETAAKMREDGRFVFIYRHRNLNVWFTHGLATGLVEGGGPESNATGTADHE